ncbi:MAG: hypothetical protein HYX48_03930 [Chlamydiales bacterium]|nr:hypothetical protein [Chlamydiales bacterium]
MKIELLFGGVRFSPLWMAVDLLLLGHFFFFWYRSYKKTGWKLDFWTFTIFLQFVLFILLMYPFSASIFNIPALGRDYERVEPFVDKAFSIGAVGYLFLWVGRYLHDRPRRRVNFLPLKKLMSGMERIIERNISSKRSCYALLLLTIALFALIAPFFFSAGFGFSARDYFIRESSLRPLFNLTICAFTVAIWYFGVRYQQWRKKETLLLLFALFFLSLFLGSRLLTFFNLLMVLSYRIFFNKGRVTLWKVAAFMPVFLLGAIFLASARTGIDDPFHLLLNFWYQTLYGSHLSDNRDFAWLLSYWDGEYLYGKSYLAALLSFLPRFASEFREAWSYGGYVTELVQFDRLQHTGLRSGPFGEAYLNFGWVGVMAMGTIGGYVLRLADVKLKEAVLLHGNIVKGFAGTFAFIVVTNFFNTSGFWLLYFFILINLALYMIGRSKSRILFAGKV